MQKPTSASYRTILAFSLILGVLVAIQVGLGASTAPKVIPYSELRALVDAGEVVDVDIQEGQVIATKKAKHGEKPETVSAARIPGHSADDLVRALAAKSFDTIVTPWLVDILPGDFAELCAHINHWLDDNGVWINFGSLSFHQSDPAAQFSPDECFEIIEANGFAAPSHRETVIPYLNSPASRHARRETVLSWSAVKSAHRKKVARHQSLPDWIVRGRDPIPASEHFKGAASTTRIPAHIMAMIDGKRSIADMAKLLEQQRLMPARDGEAAIRGLLIKLYDESRIRRP